MDDVRIVVIVHFGASREKYKCGTFKLNEVVLKKIMHDKVGTKIEIFDQFACKQGNKDRPSRY